MRWTMFLVIIICTQAVSGCMESDEQEAQGLPERPPAGMRNEVELFKDIEGYKYHWFDALRKWPSRKEDDLSPFIVEKDSLSENEKADWQGQEEWLRIAGLLVFENYNSSTKVFCLKGWKTVERRLVKGWPTVESRLVYTVWETDRFKYAGLRHFGDGTCYFYVVPVGEDNLDFDGSIESAQRVLNSVFAKRAWLSLDELKEPLGVLVGPEDGKTVRKTFTTTVVAKEHDKDVLILAYLTFDDKDKFNLAPIVRVSAESLLLKIEDMRVRSASMHWGPGTVTVYPPPPDMMKILEARRQ